MPLEIKSQRNVKGDTWACIPSKMLGCLSLTAEEHYLPKIVCYTMIFYIYLDHSKAVEQSQAGFCPHWWIRLGSQRSVCTHTSIVPQRAVLDDKWDYLWQHSQAGASSICNAIPGQTCATLAQNWGTSPPPQHPLDHGLMFNTGERRVTCAKFNPFLNRWIDGIVNITVD